MLLDRPSVVNRGFGCLSGPPGVLQTYQNTADGGPSSRRAKAQRALGHSCAVFFCVMRSQGFPEGTRKPGLQRKDY
jgi:hypothetical protein